MNPTNAVQQINDLASRLEAIAHWQQDQVAAATTTGSLLLDSAKWLRKCAKNTCGQGYIGCHGGERCDSDHK